MRLEAALPVVTSLAFRIQDAYNTLQQDRSHAEDSEGEGGEGEERMDREFVLGEMLRLAKDLDYGDEIGRRKMFALVRASLSFFRLAALGWEADEAYIGDMISQEALPEALVPKCLDVLRVLTPDEKDLIRLTVEVVQDLTDSMDDAEEPAVRFPLSSPC